VGYRRFISGWERTDKAFFSVGQATLSSCWGLDGSVSISGGQPSADTAPVDAGLAGARPQK